MAQFTINSENIKTIDRFVKEITLIAGESLSDTASILTIAQKTVPVGYEIDVVVVIKVKAVREV